MGLEILFGIANMCNMNTAQKPNAAQWDAINDLTETGNGGHETAFLAARHSSGAITIVVGVDGPAYIIAPNGEWDDDTCEWSQTLPELKA
jgi:hypothetical protein